MSAVDNYYQNGLHLRCCNSFRSNTVSWYPLCKFYKFWITYNEWLNIRHKCTGLRNVWCYQAQMHRLEKCLVYTRKKSVHARYAVNTICWTQSLVESFFTKVENFWLATTEIGLYRIFSLLRNTFKWLLSWQ